MHAHDDYTPKLYSIGDRFFYNLIQLLLQLYPTAESVELLLILTSSPWTVTLSWQESYISKMTYKLSKLGQTGLVFGL